jgi:hypothetical protein
MAAHFGSESIWVEQMTPPRMRARSGHPRRLSGVELTLGDDGEPPTEFRLFRPGINPSRNGPALFDEEAARLTMAAYEAHRRGPDGAAMDRPVMIDLEHLSVPGAALEIAGDGRAADYDARGWCNLELRAGELWAVDVRWTADGAARLRERRQRWVSPAFNYEILDDGQERVTSIHNIALTAMPATDGAHELIAARVKGQNEMKLSEFLSRWSKLSKSQKAMPAGDKLLKLLAIDMKTLQSVVKAMGGDPSGDITSLFATVRTFADELAAAVTGEPAPEPVNGEGGELMADNGAPEEDPAAAMARTDDAAEQLAMLTARDAKLTKEVDKLRAANHARDKADKIHRFRAAVADSGCDLTAGKVWQDSTVDPAELQLEPWLARMSLDEIDAMIKKHGGSPGALALSSVTPRPPQDDVMTESMPGIEISDYEVRRLHATVDKIWAREKLGQPTKRAYQVALEKLTEHKGQQYAWAKEEGNDRLMKLYGSKVSQGRCLSTVTGRLLPDAVDRLKTWGTTPAQPLDQFGPASQRAIEEFRTEYLINLAAELPDWTTDIGRSMPAGSLHTTFPLHFQTTEYEERTAQNKAASTPQSAEISVKQRDFHLAMQANLRRMLKGDFAYVQSWQQQGAQMARGRIKLRARLIKLLLESNPLWAVSEQYPAGLDGENFFSQSHKVNPFKTSLGTSSNLSDGSTPFDSDNLTAEKAEVLLVKDIDGIHLNMMADDILAPTILSEQIRLLIDVKDVILRDSASKDASAGVTNEHKDSGMGRIIAPQLDGSAGADSDWYLISRGVIATGRDPWVIAEDPMEEIREWGQDSDFYKNSGEIKVESNISLNAVLLWWQGIRKILGA